MAAYFIHDYNVPCKCFFRQQQKICLHVNESMVTVYILNKKGQFAIDVFVSHILFTGYSFLQYFSVGKVRA